MGTSWSGWYWHLAGASLLAIGYAIAASGDCALAQIKPDATLGANESSVVTPNVDINGITTDRIDGGAKRGANLFHSFQEFNVGSGRGAYFTNPTGIVNILSRVTGNDPSDILGTLGVLGNANLFLINPNGIIFGPNARLDIRGSILASTASSLNFADGTQFSATAPQTTPLLTVSVPLGLQYGGTAESILNQSQATNSSGEVVGLQVQQGKTLALVGGDVRLNAGNVFAPGGRVELGGVAGAGTLGLNVNGNNLSLSFPDRVARADVSLTNGSAVDVTAEGEGSIAIEARNLGVLGGSSLSAGIQSGLGSVGRQAGDITLSATDAITVEQMSSIGNKVKTDAIGQGGNLTIKTRQLLVRDGGQISASTEAQGQGGDLDVIASDSVEVAGRLPNGRSSRLAADTQGTGAAGNLRIQTRKLVVRDQASVSASSDSIDENAGAGGNLTIDTGQLVVRDGGRISAATAGVGSGGTLTVIASESVEVNGTSADRSEPSRLDTSSGFYDPAPSNARAKAGSLTIHTPRLSIKGGAVVNSSASSQGQGGDLDVIASDSVEVAGRSLNGGLSSLAADTQGTGAVGNLRIQTRNLLVQDGGIVSAETFGVGKGGNLNITTWLLDVQGSGKITVGSTNTDSAALGAGDIEVTARSVFLDNQGKLSAETESGLGGNITLQAQDLLLMRDNSQISSTAGAAQSAGDGGNITINTPFIIALPNENSDITANAFKGSGGRIAITAQSVFGLEPRSRQELQTLLEPDDPLDPIRLPSNDITAISRTNPDLSGVITFNVPDVDPSQGLVTLPAELVDASGLIAQTCPAGRGQGQSEFIVTGRGGLPDNPSDLLSSDAVEVDLVTLNPKVENRSSPTVSTNSTSLTPDPIVEAQGWVIGANGSVVLTATAPTVTPHSPGLTPESCHKPQSAPKH